MCIIGCESQPITAEAEPKPAPRLTFSEDYIPDSFSTYMFIITDTKNDQEYLFIQSANGNAICPMVKQENQLCN